MTCNPQDMIIVHRVFRREFAAVLDLVRTVPDGDSGRATVVAGHLDLLLDLLHHHHDTEDVLLWPLLVERAPQHRAVLEVMEAQHEQLSARIAQVQTSSRDWSVHALSGAGIRLATDLEAMVAPMLAHLDHEEQEALPLCVDLLTQEEWNRLGERAIGALGPENALLILASMQEGSPEQEWQEFVALLPPPVAEAYATHGAAAYQPYIDRLRSVQSTRHDVGAITDRFLAAAEHADTTTMRSIYTPDAVIWHNDGTPGQTVDENLAFLQMLFGGLKGLEYEVQRRHVTANSVFQTHVLHIVLPDGGAMDLDAAMVIEFRDGRISRIEEYLDMKALDVLMGAVTATVG